jgi:hypothetical protein
VQYGFRKRYFCGQVGFDGFGTLASGTMTAVDDDGSHIRQGQFCYLKRPGYISRAGILLIAHNTNIRRDPNSMVSGMAANNAVFVFFTLAFYAAMVIALCGNSGFDLSWLCYKDRHRIWVCDASSAKKLAKLRCLVSVLVLLFPRHSFYMRCGTFGKYRGK